MWEKGRKHEKMLSKTVRRKNQNKKTLQHTILYIYHQEIQKIIAIFDQNLNICQFILPISAELFTYSTFFRHFSQKKITKSHHTPTHSSTICAILNFAFSKAKKSEIFRWVSRVARLHGGVENSMILLHWNFLENQNLLLCRKLLYSNLWLDPYLLIKLRKLHNLFVNFCSKILGSMLQILVTSGADSREIAKKKLDPRKM